MSCASVGDLPRSQCQDLGVEVLGNLIVGVLREQSEQRHTPPRGGDDFSAGPDLTQRFRSTDALQARLGEPTPSTKARNTVGEYWSCSISTTTEPAGMAEA